MQCDHVVSTKVTYIHGERWTIHTRNERLTMKVKGDGSNAVEDIVGVSGSRVGPIQP